MQKGDGGCFIVASSTACRPLGTKAIRSELVGVSLGLVRARGVSLGLGAATIMARGTLAHIAPAAPLPSVNWQRGSGNAGSRGVAAQHQAAPVKLV
jgi:hypothetical protein